MLQSAAGLAGEPGPYRESRRIMGTFCEVQVYDADALRARSAIRAALDEMERVDHLLSNYDPASELSKMNREASSGAFRASPELFAFVKACRRFYDDSLGAFDPAVGALVRAWGFFSPQPGIPSAAEIAAAKVKSGFDKVRLNDAGRSVSYTVPGLEFDPGGVGKGYAVDRAAEVLRRQHIRSALVSAGGSTLYGLGHPPGRKGWRVALANPADSDAPLAFVDLRDNSLSTSGVSQQSVKTEGRRYSHIFDPRNGEPVENMCQVTVVARGGTESDALTKAAFVLSREEVSPVLRQHAGARALRMEGDCAHATIWMTPNSMRTFERDDSLHPRNR